MRFLAVHFLRTLLVTVTHHLRTLPFLAQELATGAHGKLRLALGDILGVTLDETQTPSLKG